MLEERREELGVLVMGGLPSRGRYVDSEFREDEGLDILCEHRGIE